MDGDAIYWYEKDKTCNILVNEELGKKSSKLDVRVEMFHEKGKSIQ